MSKVINSHKPAGVFTFIPSEYPTIVQLLKDFSFSSNDSLLGNYTSINWMEFSAISIYKRDNKIIGFSSIWHRPEYYSNGEVRILNRYYESSQMRRLSKIIADDHLIEMVNQQLNIAKNLGFRCAFISREKTPKYFRKLVEKISQKTKTQWVTEPEKVCVCSPNASSCWQYKAWTKL